MHSLSGTHRHVSAQSLRAASSLYFAAFTLAFTLPRLRLLGKVVFK